MEDSYQDGYQGGYNFADDSGYTGDGQNVESGHYGQSDGISAQGGDKINARDDDEKKLFVGGLSWETTQMDLKDYFSNFGDLVDVTVKTDPVTGRSRGFGFVLFTDVAAVDNVMQQQTHTLNNRTIDPKRAKTRGGREAIKKIFVGGLDPNFPETALREYFGKFGKIEEIELPYDKLKDQRRAFCFITFDSEDAVDEICKQAKQMIGSKECDVKKATPRSEAKRGGYDGQGGGYGGQGGGYGGQGGGYGGQSGVYGGQGGGGYGGQASYGYSGGRGRGRSGGYNQNQVYGRSNYSSYNQNYGYGQGYGGYSG